MFIIIYIMTFIIFILYNNNMSSLSNICQIIQKGLCIKPINDTELNIISQSTNKRNGVKIVFSTTLPKKVISHPIYEKDFFTSNSDRRIKKNIEVIDNKYALEQLLNIIPTSYNYIDEIANGIKKRIWIYCSRS